MRKITSVLILISITLFTVNAQKCSDVQAQLSSGKVCQSTDTACQTALTTFIACTLNCTQSNNAESAVGACFIKNCSNISNPTVQNYYNQLINCTYSVLLFSSLFFLVAFLL
ncbi:transmembrane protein, putative (macronuclear) [Tetrahymena thermophila SB210]|uniref:Transmembrane protein, putative n=1 Tax=Tetrahymena thermophila (strain SB210) TaxID=312017 RepID=Q23BM7_TETTS|nr:transmembrane protein, putative [Tetrahymena thermophila SB210]EAR94091.1 transmembrane protein, putative [Tetrahymena thermophila SB210]|eukprot:XP_001014336.1 transmembrane protein, putative [Tetrahymena thermophila SB210]